MFKFIFPYANFPQEIISYEMSGNVASELILAQVSLNRLNIVTNI